MCPLHLQSVSAARWEQLQYSGKRRSLSTCWACKTEKLLQCTLVILALQEVQFVDLDDDAISALNEELAQQKQALSPSKLHTPQDDSSGIQSIQRVGARSYLSCMLCCIAHPRLLVTDGPQVKPSAMRPMCGKLYLHTHYASRSFASTYRLAMQRLLLLSGEVQVRNLSASCMTPTSSGRYVHVLLC